MTESVIQGPLTKKKIFYSSINNCLLSVLLSWLHTLSISRSLFAKMRVMCYERYPRFHTFWGPWRWRDQLSISQHPCSWLPPARESHRQPERQIQSEREKKDKDKRSQEVFKKRPNQLDFTWWRQEHFKGM